ncbi:hypothetical protein, partial [Rhizobium sp. SJZ105]|uniref:hypothetical protein n=1 Tax=Rhizobium sp. SJZ105 TaxID=2572678 RepID=UPI001AED681F
NYHWDHSVPSSIAEVLALASKSVQVFIRIPAGSILSENQQNSQEQLCGRSEKAVRDFRGQE